MKNQIDKRRAGAERIGQIGKALKKAELCGVLNEKILSPKVLFHSMFNSLKNMHFTNYIDQDGYQTHLNAVDWRVNGEKSICCFKRKEDENKDYELKFSEDEGKFYVDYREIDEKDALKNLLSIYKKSIQECKDFRKIKEKESSPMISKLMELCKKIPDVGDTTQRRDPIEGYIDGKHVKLRLSRDLIHATDAIIIKEGSRRQVLFYNFINGTCYIETKNGYRPVNEKELERIIDSVEKIIKLTPKVDPEVKLKEVKQVLPNIEKFLEEDLSNFVINDENMSNLLEKIEDKLQKNPKIDSGQLEELLVIMEKIKELKPSWSYYVENQINGIIYVIKHI